jgi:hypothetical protein
MSAQTPAPLVSVTTYQNKDVCVAAMYAAMDGVKQVYIGNSVQKQIAVTQNQGWTILSTTLDRVIAQFKCQ